MKWLYCYTYKLVQALIKSNFDLSI